ncbi:hypothetical protein OCS_02787 [Ophiocordyceps sinensis CO18]|uniref:Uncharacterized protein n=1 Tax=Ophiocordyceps sinensis (strain Co18 / CGMCC 3.14243) TaxID=911162 RepID=T5AGF2_OPHSC|nr:hypothetical protein OCS_02787 [Ophiocordyceps sinensis CO18]
MTSHHRASELPRPGPSPGGPSRSGRERYHANFHRGSVSDEQLAMVTCLRATNELSRIFWIRGQGVDPSSHESHVWRGPCSPVVEAGVLAAKAYIQVHGYNPTAEGLQGTDKHATNMRRLPCGHLAWRLLEPSVHVASRVLMSGQTKKAFSAGPRWGTSDAPSATSFASGNGEERSYRNEYCYLQTQQDIKIPKFFCTFAEVVNRKTIPNKKADPEGYFQYVAEKLTASAVT